MEHQDGFLLVDCSCGVEDVLKYTSKLDAIVITHGHFDHFCSLEQIQSTFNCPVYIHPNAYQKFSDPRLNASYYFSKDVVCNIPPSSMMDLVEGSNRIANIPVEVMFAFGHTDDSVVILIEDNLFVGDFIFENGYGRTDLPTGSAEEMYKSLRKYLPLRKKYNLFYGHDAC